MKIIAKPSAKDITAPRAFEVSAPRSDQASEILLTRQAQLIAMLSREGGANLNDLNTAFRWLPHTTRATLTKLRNKGHRVNKNKIDGINYYSISRETVR